MHFLSPTLKKEKDKCANPLKRPRHWFRKNQVHHCTTERFYGTLNMASVARKKNPSTPQQKMVGAQKTSH